MNSYSLKTSVGVTFLAGTIALAQTGTNRNDGDFHLAGIAADNLEKAIQSHLTSTEDFQLTKQLPEDRQNDPHPLVLKDGTFYFDWTPGQQARYLMEQLRQGIHALQAAPRAQALDATTLKGARDSWPKMRDISCRENPGIRYYDLDGAEQYCPTK